MHHTEVIWNKISPLLSSTNAQKFLLNQYVNKNIPGAETKSYENSYTFIYYLEHGKSFYSQAIDSPLSIKPILLFYGMVQLLKACLLTVDPDYPSSTSVLAHGVSSRKRKKQDYEFLHDEVKIQKNGLFPYFSEKMFHVEQLEGNKYSMESLLTKIPEMNSIFQFSFQQNAQYEIGQIDKSRYFIPNSILDDLHMTYSRFESFLESSLPFKFTLEDKEEGLDFSPQLKEHPLFISPISYHYFDRKLYLPRDREGFKPFPEIMTHYLLLYNLSMICRYETEWWSELLHHYSSTDYPFIKEFLSITKYKVPDYLFSYLVNKKD